VAEGLSSGLSIANVARIGLEDHDLHMDRRAEIRVDAPDLAPSSLSVWPWNRWSDWAMEGVTCTLTLANAGVDDAPSATAAISLPRAARLVTGSLRVASGVATVTERRVFWSGAVEQSTSVTLSYALLPSPTLESGLLYMVAFLDDGRGGAWERPAWIETGPLVLRLPLLLREG
jgi:hypothetical protein